MIATLQQQRLIALIACVMRQACAAALLLAAAQLHHIWSLEWQREGRTGKKSALAWAQGQAHIIQYDKREGTTHININTYWPCNGPAFQKRRLEGKEILFGGRRKMPSQD